RRPAAGDARRVHVPGGQDLGSRRRRRRGRAGAAARNHLRVRCGRGRAESVGRGGVAGGAGADRSHALAPPEDSVSRPTIVYFGNDWSAENRTSSHHVARWLAKRYDVIYVESPGLRAPKGTGRDLKKLVAKVGLALRGPRPTPEGLAVQTMLQIPFHGSALVRRANRHLLVA